jgi:hypothetical protein
MKLRYGKNRKRVENQMDKADIFNTTHSIFSDRILVPEILGNSVESRDHSVSGFWKDLQRSRDADTMLSP